MIGTFGHNCGADDDARVLATLLDALYSSEFFDDAGEHSLTCKPKDQCEDKADTEGRDIHPRHPSGFTSEKRSRLEPVLSCSSDLFPAPAFRRSLLKLSLTHLRSSPSFAEKLP